MMIASFNLEGSSSSSAGQVVVVTTADEVVNNQQVPTAEVEASPERVALLSGWRRITSRS
jgi:hypothetical protein